MAVALGLLGSCAAVAALADSSAGSTRTRGSSRAAAGSASAGMAAAALRTGLRLGSPRPGSAAAAASTRTGLLLMSEAAAACEKVYYRGVQIVVWWGQGGTSASVVQVWHRPGSADLAETPATAVLPSQPQSGASQEPDQGGSLALSGQMLALMEANYQIGSAGRGTADGRAADIVELRRSDGSLAARFWLDVATKLPLRREVYSPASAMISEDAFISLQTGESSLGGMPAAAVRPWTQQLDSAKVTALRAEGWPLPARLAGNLSLFRASETSSQAGQVVDLSYSDGLSVVSLFLQRGQLPQALAGWQRVAVSGHSVFSDDPDNRSLAWSAHGFVFTVIADAPSATVGQVVTELPHDSKTGLWQRMTRGMRRLASWVNPFG
jgi:sigma-E factor negative regulatory protein RseB